MVIACPIPLCGLSGATTTTLAKSDTASTRLRIPLLVISSSLVIKITGRVFFFNHKLLVSDSFIEVKQIYIAVIVTKGK